MNRTTAVLVAAAVLLLGAAALFLGRQPGAPVVEPPASPAALEPSAPPGGASPAPQPDARPSTAAFTPAERSLIDRWDDLNATCRGASGDDPATWKACDARDRLGPQLNAGNLCYGREGESGAENRWHRCGPDSLRFPGDTRH